MAQRKPHAPMAIRPAVEIVDADESAVMAVSEPFAQARKAAPGVPTRAQLQFERQRIRMQFQKERSAGAIRLTAELHDEASLEATQSLALSHHLERGFGEDLTEQERAFFADMKQALLAGTTQITAQAIQTLMDLAEAGELPDTEVSDLLVLWRWLKTN